MRARECVGLVVAVEPVMGDAVLLSFTAPAGMAANVRAGQFVEVLCREEGSHDPLLRRAYSVCTASAVDDTLTLLVRPFGRGSAWLVRRQPGDWLNVLGLLGNTFSVAPTSLNLLMVAGGVGVAPLILLTEEAVAEGRNVTFLMGAATKQGMLPASHLPASVEYAVATQDGSRGHHGLVTELVADYAGWADQVFACGPEPMFRSLKRTLDRYRLGGKPAAQVSTDRPMACGLGACHGCVVETKRGKVRSCVEGPVFDLDELVW
jgi:dihydroorotate dehydrogenase electron transfer subunit